MIFDKIEHLERYSLAHEGLQKALKVIRDFEYQIPGKYEIDGDRIYASVQEYETKSNACPLFENHKKYIDIQYVVSGREEILTDITDGKTVAQPFSVEKDCELFEGSESVTRFCMDGGSFLILFPGEAHAPGRSFDGKTSKVRKILIKIEA